jgi:outer membrane protein assembly factor BamB
LRVAVCILGLAFATAGCNADWAQLGFDPGHSGGSSDTSLSTAALAHVNQRWTVPTGGLFGFTSDPVIAGGVTYWSLGYLTAWDRTGNETWFTPNQYIAGVPAIQGGNVYAADLSGSLDVYDAAGNTNCGGGTPKSCSPLWTATLPATSGLVTSAVVVAGGTVYGTNSDSKIWAVDAAGTRNCSGTPKTCTPLWTASTGTSGGDVAVADGRLYVVSSSGLQVFDAFGVQGCSGTPVVCTPLWSSTDFATTPLRPTVANGTVYVAGADGRISAFDATGTQNCGGVPKTCTHLWRTQALGLGAATVAGGTLYAGSNDGNLYAFDAASTQQCAGSPKVCAPLWHASADTSLGQAPPTVANGVVYAGTGGTLSPSPQTYKVYAFDANGSTDCSGVPNVCSPLWSRTSPGGEIGQVVVSDALVAAKTLIFAPNHPTNELVVYSAN